jgi:hypothetical protein
MDYTMVGGTVNLGSRLEHEAPPGGVLISFETFAHVKDEILCEERGHIQVKGITHPVAIYSVVGIKGELASAAAPVGADTPHMRLEIAPDLMSSDERAQAANALRRVLGALESRSDK